MCYKCHSFQRWMASNWKGEGDHYPQKYHPDGSTIMIKNVGIEDHVVLRKNAWCRDPDIPKYLWLTSYYLN